jgi:hypothetical protein
MVPGLLDFNASGIDLYYIFYPGWDRGYWILMPPALISFSLGILDGIGAIGFSSLQAGPSLKSALWLIYL